MDNLEEWQEKREVSTKELDDLLSKLRDAKLKHQQSKAVTDSLYEEMKGLEDSVVSLLKYAGKSTYIAEGVGRATLKQSLSVQTPKTPEEKVAFFNWVKENMGEDAYYAYLNVNSQSLNSLYRQKVVEYGEQGKVLDIAGIQAPVEYTTLSFTKS